MLAELQELDGVDLETTIKLAECELTLNRGREDWALRKIRENFPSDSTNASHVWHKADEYYGSRKYTAAMFLFKISCELQIEGDALSGIDKSRSIVCCVANMKCIVNSLVQSGGASCEIANRYGLKYMQEMVNSLHSIAPPDVIVAAEASCIADITSVLNQLGAYQGAIEVGEEIVQRIKEQFGDDATSHKHYGWILNNIGIAYQSLEKHRKAEEYYTEAIEVNEKARDYENENKRRQHNIIVQKNLETVRAAMEPHTSENRD